MEAWMKISLVLCTCGFLKDIRPSEPFVTEFLTGEWRNFTREQVNREIYPVYTYAYLPQLVIAFLVIDFLRYKPLIVVSGIAGMVVWSMLLWTTSLRSLQVLEVFYGTYMATDVAYFTYMYAKVDKQHYQKVTSHTHAATLAGKFIGGALSQVLVYFKWMDYMQLNYLTLATQTMATVWALFLPNVKTSLYFHRPTDNQSLVMDPGDGGEHNRSPSSVKLTLSNNGNCVENGGSEKNNKAIGPFKLLWLHFKTSYTNKQVLQWSIWYALAMCGYYQIVSYIQVLWLAIGSKEEAIWNGAVAAILTLLGAIVSFLAGYLHTSKLTQRSSLLCLVILSVLEGCVVLLTAKTSLIWISYVGYILFGVLNTFSITVASAEVAKHLKNDCFGLVFGINTLMSVVMQTILTLLVVSKKGFRLHVIGQFSFYGFYYIGIGVIFLVAVVIDYVSEYNSKKSVRKFSQ